VFLGESLFFFLCVELLRPYKWLGLVGSDILECSYVQLRNWVLIEPSEFFSFWTVAALLVWMWWGAINHDSRALLSNRESVAALAALLGWGRTEEEAAETWARMGRCPNHKNSHGKHYSHKTARRAKFLVKDILATSPFSSFSFSCFPVSSSHIGNSSSML